MERANAHSMLVRRGHVLHGSITRSIGPSTADSIREKAAVDAQITASRVRSIGADSKLRFLCDCAKELFIGRVAATFFNVLETRKNVNSAIEGGKDEMSQRKQSWCYNGFRRASVQYPKHMSFLDASQILGEDNDLDKGEQAYEDEELSSDAVAEADTSQTGDAVAAFPEHMEVAGKSNEELEVTLVPVSAVSAYLLMKYTKLLETNAAVAADLQNVGAVAHAASRVVEQSKEARRRRNNFALPQQDHDIGRRRGHEADQENRRPYTATAKLGATAVRVVAVTLGNIPITSARSFTTPDGEEDSGGAFIMMMIKIICTVVIMQLASCIANSMCAGPATPRLYKARGTQTLVVIVTQSIWVEPKNGQGYHLDKDCGTLLCTTRTRRYTACHECG